MKTHLQALFWPDMQEWFPYVGLPPILMILVVNGKTQINLIYSFPVSSSNLTYASILDKIN